MDDILRTKNSQSKTNIFDTVAFEYDAVLPGHISDYYLSKRIKFFAPYLSDNIKILDVGCGTGRIITALSLRNKILVYGCDESMGMLKRIKNEEGISINCCLAEEICFKSNTFDVIISVAVFHHFANEEIALKALSEMVRVAKKGAKVIIWDANSLNPYWFLLFKRVSYDKDVKKILSCRKIVKEAKKLNLESIKILKKGWIPDFAPKRVLCLLRCLEYIFERVPFLKLFSAHNVIIITK